MKDDAGKRYTVTETTTFETGRTIGGEDVPVDVRHMLDDGTLLEASLGEGSFLDRARGKVYERV